MAFEIRPFRAEDADAWDRLISEAILGSFIQTRRFLSYHGDSFEDASLCCWEGGSIIGVLPAARDPSDQATVTSHPGITYGGWLHTGRLRGNDMIEALRGALDYYGACGYRRLRYRPVPRIYQRVPAEDDLYALFRLDARRHRCDLAAVIDLANPLPMSSRRKRALNKARASSLELAEGAALLPGLWEVLEDNLARRHSARATHSLEEIQLLAELFPQNILPVGALEGGALIAGVVLFLKGTTVHAQYISASERGFELNALALVFDRAIAMARDLDARYFSFGTSNEDAGRVLNDGLYRFKSEFGAAGCAHEFYEVDIAPAE